MSTLNLGDSLILNSDIVVNGGEVKTGATWNGRPVYAQAWAGNLLTAGGSVKLFYVSTTSLNIREIVNYTQVLTTASGWNRLGTWYADSTNLGTLYIASNGNLTAEYGSAYSTLDSCTLTLWYTKTTD